MTRKQMAWVVERVGWKCGLMWKVLVAAAVAIGLAGGARAQTVTIGVHTQQVGAEISENMLGLSYETSLMLPDERGMRYFRPENTALVGMFKTLGVRSLRVGGNSVDAASVAVPGEADVASLFEFARAAGVKVIYAVRLQEGDAAAGGAAARVARQIHAHYADVLESFAIGNEPDYYKDYAVYKPKWMAIRDAMRAEFPEAKFSGPDTNPTPVLTKDMVTDFAGAGGLVQITQHSYPFGCAYRNPQVATQDPAGVSKLIAFDAGAAREKMLDPAIYDTYEPIRKEMAAAVAGTSLSFRLTETNSFWFSGLAGASDRYAAALWGVDYLYWWATHAAAGVNFHTGDRTGGAVNLPCAYAVFVSAERGFALRPLGYAMKAFDLGGHGRAVGVDVPTEAQRGLAAYATVREKTVCVTVINRAHGAGAGATALRVDFDMPMANGEIICLTARDGDIETDGSKVTFGGAGIAEDGTWKGEWAPVRVSDEAPRDLVVSVPAASVAVVRAVVR